MTVYTEAELAYLQGERRLAHVAMVGNDGTLDVTLVGMWSIDPGSGVVEVTGHIFAATKKFRDVAGRWPVEHGGRRSPAPRQQVEPEAAIQPRRVEGPVERPPTGRGPPAMP